MKPEWWEYMFECTPGSDFVFKLKSERVKAAKGQLFKHGISFDDKIYKYGNRIFQHMFRRKG